LFISCDDKYYGVKMMDIETKASREVADEEKKKFEPLKGFSPYLVNLVECFDEVFFFFFFLFFFIYLLLFGRMLDCL
jgi:hypothetical protein